MMNLLERSNDSDVFVLTEDPRSVFPRDISASVLSDLLLVSGFAGILWDHWGLERVLTRDILQEGLDTYRAAHSNPRAPIASHVGVFLWEQTISREEADQRGQARTGDSTGPEDEPDQTPLET